MFPAFFLFFKKLIYLGLRINRASTGISSSLTSSVMISPDFSPSKPLSNPPNAIDTASSIVVFPEPLLPTRTVRSSDSFIVSSLKHQKFSRCSFFIFIYTTSHTSSTLLHFTNPIIS